MGLQRILIGLLLMGMLIFSAGVGMRRLILIPMDYISTLPSGPARGGVRWRFGMR
jgi:hypothetical protein